MGGGITGVQVLGAFELRLRSLPIPIKPKLHVGQRGMRFRRTVLKLKSFECRLPGLWTLQLASTGTSTITLGTAVTGNCPQAWMIGAAGIW